MTELGWNNLNDTGGVNRKEVEFIEIQENYLSEEQILEQTLKSDTDFLETIGLKLGNIATLVNFDEKMEHKLDKIAQETSIIEMICNELEFKNINDSKFYIGGIEQIIKDKGRNKRIIIQKVHLKLDTYISFLVYQFKYDNSEYWETEKIRPYYNIDSRTGYGDEIENSLANKIIRLVNSYEQTYREENMKNFNHQYFINLDKFRKNFSEYQAKYKRVLKNLDEGRYDLINGEDFLIYKRPRDIPILKVDPYLIKSREIYPLIDLNERVHIGRQENQPFEREKKMSW